jgi:hypothetical protein
MRPRSCPKPEKKRGGKKIKEEPKTQQKEKREPEFTPVISPLP